MECCLSAQGSFSLSFLFILLFIVYLHKVEFSKYYYYLLKKNETIIIIIEQLTTLFFLSSIWNNFTSFFLH